MAPHRIRFAKAGQARSQEAVIPAFASFDGTVIHYEQVGGGEPVMLLHSFPFDSRVWHGTGVVDAITAAGRSVITADRRGSGRSARPRDPRAYRGNACARDVTSLIDHLRLSQVDLAGYSVGSMIGLRVLQADPRVRRAVLGGVGDDIVHLDPRLREQVAADLLIDTPRPMAIWFVTDIKNRLFWRAGTGRASGAEFPPRRPPRGSRVPL